MFLSPSSIHFTSCTGQQTVEEITHERDIIEASRHFVQNLDRARLQVAQKDGHYFTLNNTRLLVFRRLEKEGRCKRVKVDCIPLNAIPAGIRMMMIVPNFKTHNTNTVADDSGDGSDGDNGCDCRGANGGDGGDGGERGDGDNDGMLVVAMLVVLSSSLDGNPSNANCTASKPSALYHKSLSFSTYSYGIKQRWNGPLSPIRICTSTCVSFLVTLVLATCSLFHIFDYEKRVNIATDVSNALIRVYKLVCRLWPHQLCISPRFLFGLENQASKQFHMMSFLGGSVDRINWNPPRRKRRSANNNIGENYRDCNILKIYYNIFISNHDKNLHILEDEDSSRLNRHHYSTSVSDRFLQQA
uniref:Uncharacterized protein n=1 Tax=Octopus bimaculoides TaxID=37653 RepID=A0A0L8HLD1_OCTBM